MFETICIGPHQIGEHQPPYIISEAGVNHNGSLDLAKKLVDTSKSCGAHAVKFQNFKAEKLAQRSTPKVPYQTQDAPDSIESHFQMLKKLEMDEGMTKELFQYCQEQNITFLSTPYDPESVYLLAELGVQAIKVASADLVDVTIHEAIIETGLPVILSVGMANENEIRDCIHQYREKDHDYPIMALQCTSNYPSDPYNANVAVIKWLGETYDVIPGFSDHSNDFRCSSLALANGARVFERHFTLDKSMPGPDHKASSNPEEMIRYIKNLKESQRIIGHSQKTIAEEELNMRRISRKGVYLKRDYPAGAIVDRKDLVCIRPAMGDDVRSIFICLSRPLKTALQKGQQLRQEHF